MGMDQHQLWLSLPAEILLSQGWGPCGQVRCPEHGHFCGQHFWLHQAEGTAMAVNSPGGHL